MSGEVSLNFREFQIICMEKFTWSRNYNISWRSANNGWSAAIFVNMLHYFLSDMKTVHVNESKYKKVCWGRQNCNSILSNSKENFILSRVKKEVNSAKSMSKEHRDYFSCPVFRVKKTVTLASLHMQLREYNEGYMSSTKKSFYIWLF